VVIADQRVADHENVREQIERHGLVRAPVVVADPTIAAAQHDHLDDRPAAAEFDDASRSVRHVGDGAKARPRRQQRQIFDGHYAGAFAPSA